MTPQQRLDDIRQIILDNQDYLFRVAYFRVGCREDAEDIVQTAFMRFWEKAPKLDCDRDVRLYLYRIIYNLCNDCREARAARQPLNEADAFPDTAEADRELRAEYCRITSLLAALPPSQRQVIEMHLMHDLTFVEISGILRLPETTLKSRFKSGITRLRKQINAD